MAGRCSRGKRSIAAFLVVAVLAVVLVSATGIALLLAPGFVLAVCLLAGFYPGEQTIEKLRARLWRDKRPTRSRNVTTWHRSPHRQPVGITLAFALAVRPPPRTAATAL